VKREGLPVVAVGVVACAGCCAPPILAALGITLGVAAVAWLAVGVVAAGVAVAVGLSVIQRRRRVPA
jgi:hypothetical protein